MPEPLDALDPEILVIPDPEHDRYTSLQLLGWWDQQKVRNATILVAGAGALGNEVLKNLALIGIGHLLVVDFDRIEAANLTRSILFRASDHGRSKAEVAARAVRAINPDCAVRWIDGDLLYDLGAGIYRHVDAVIGCLDNREARLVLNRACYRVGRPWVDGALHEMLGEARVFWPGRGGCYECTLGIADYWAINLRYSCSSLARDAFLEGKIATTPTTASIIGAVQAQEALKLLHGLEVTAGRGLVFNGLNNDTYTVTYPVHTQCFSHGTLSPIDECPELSASSTMVGDLLEHVRAEMGPEAFLELSFDLLVRFECAAGHSSPLVLRRATQVPESAALCPECSSQRWPWQAHAIRGDEPFLDRTLREIGVPPLDIVCGRVGRQRRYFELTGDVRRILDFSSTREE